LQGFNIFFLSLSMIPSHFVSAHSQMSDLKRPGDFAAFLFAFPWWNLNPVCPLCLSSPNSLLQR
jgi:hypothetical protein